MGLLIGVGDFGLEEILGAASQANQTAQLAITNAQTLFNNIGVYLFTPNSLNELRTKAGNAGSRSQLLGYTTPGDGGGGVFYWDPASTATDDGSMVIKVTGVNTGRHIRVIEGGRINVKWFGAKGDGTVDDRPAVQKAIDFARFIQQANGGNVRAEIIFPFGQYLIRTQPLNFTNINGLSVRGLGGKYVNVTIIGDTGDQIFDCSGATMMQVSGFTFVSGHTWPTPSTIGVQFALTSVSPTNPQSVGGLNCTITDCYFQMDDNPDFNGGFGTIGHLNIRGEETGMFNTVIRANTGAIYSFTKQVNALGRSFTASSQFATLTDGNGSMGVIDIGGNVSIENYEKRSPALIFISANTIRCFGYLSRVPNVDNTPITKGNNEFAIVLVGETDNAEFGCNIEQFSQIALLGQLTTLLKTVITAANQTNPLLPVFDATGTALKDVDLGVSFTIPSEYNNGRVFLYHAPVNGGDSPATGFIINSTFRCSGWIDNRKFITGNAFRASANSDFLTGQPFAKRNGAFVDLKTYSVPIGLTTGGAGTVTTTILHFDKADKTTKTVGNAGFYELLIRGCVRIGSYSSIQPVVADFESRVLLTQNQAGNINGIQAKNTIFNKSLSGNSYMDILIIGSSIDISGGTGLVNLRVDYSGSLINEPILFNGTFELISDFAVNQSLCTA